jgi:hypothetical protein
MRRLKLGDQDAMKATVQIIVPLVVGLVAMIVLPPLACFGLSAVIERYTGLNGLSLAGNRFICECTLIPSP